MTPINQHMRFTIEQKAKKEGGGGAGAELQEEDIEAILNEVRPLPQRLHSQDK